ncbi:MAG: hypothetical protein HQL35_04835 [Alphaproteobacteria bacterium]|nr:hypothetical protein [Alphaproteobacteria bacterium]
MVRDFTALRPSGGFRVISADPAWRFKTYSEKGQDKCPDYDTMTIGEIRDMPVEILAAKDCVLFLWVTWPMMPDWNSVIESWGFEYAGLAWEWRKFNPVTGKYAFGPGYGTRKNLEPCLLATRGNPQLKPELPDDLFGLGRVPEGVRSVRDWIECWPDEEIRAPRDVEHSRKPDEQYERIETLFDGPYVELFARQKWPGWRGWGKEYGKLALRDYPAPKTVKGAFRSTGGAAISGG